MTSHALKNPVGGNSAKIEITNTIAGGDFTAQLAVGHNKTKVNVILDTGSSTLAILDNHFIGVEAKPTHYVQTSQYGSGSWGGPVVSTPMEIGSGKHTISL